MNFQQERILCLDLRKTRFGFVVLEGPARLLDWGGKEFEGERDTLENWGCRQFEDLLNSYQPTRVVVGAPRDSVGIANCLLGRMLISSLNAHRISVRIVTRRKLRALFQNQNKYSIAEAIVQRFPELIPRLPVHPRRIYEPEPHSMTIFDAVALGLTYFRHSVQKRTLPTAPANS